MTTQRRSRRSYPQRGNRQPSGSWFNNQSVPAVVTGGGSAMFDLFPTGAGQLQARFEAGFLVRRCIAEVQFQAVLSATTSYGSFGIQVASRDAFDSSAVPEPINDLADWYWHKNFWLRGRDDEMVSEKIDLRTMRRVRGSTRTLVFSIQVAPGQASLEFSFNHRSWLTP